MRRTCFSAGLVVTLLAAAVFMISCSDDDCPVCDNDQPLVRLNAHKVDFGASSTEASFVISNTGGGSLAWDLEIGYRNTVAKIADDQQGDWLSLSANSGEGDATVFLTADREQIEGVGVHRAVVYVNTPSAENKTRDSVEVFILNGSEWVINDDGSYEACWNVDNFDYYWMKEFRLPEGIASIFVDSIAINFCEADTVVQFVSFNSQFDEPNQLFIPASLLWTINAYTPVVSGWNTVPVDWYFNFEPFYIGYFQPGATVPRPQLDRESDNPELISWRIRQINDDFENPQLQAQAQAGFQTLAIRIFVTPRLTYNPKLVASYEERRASSAEALLRTGIVYDGDYPASPKPRIDR